jgi:site-specific DNA-methyltransferase (adenine-specific)
MCDIKNKILEGDCLEIMPSLKDEQFDLVIADPPYYKVIGEKWDYKWRTENDYVTWCEKWFKEVYRLLRFGGTFYLFGYFRTLVLLVPRLLEIGFDLRQQIIINKGIKSVAGRATKNYKMFPNVTESVLFLTKKNITYSRKFLKSKQKELGISAKEINEALGVKSNGGGMWSIYTGDNICEQFPTEELWDKLKSILHFDLPYSKIAQTFNHEIGITDVWDDIDFYKEKRYHPTQKPIKLIKRLILASSNEGDSVLDPFGGCATTLIASELLNRNAIIIEQNTEYIEKSYQRLKDIRISPHFC